MFRTGFNHDVDAVSLASGLCCEDESLAVQSAEEESNINTIVKRFGISGELPSDVRMPRSGDFTNMPDFHSAMNTVRQAQEEFMRIPADLRARFSNDPGKFMVFLDDESNRDEANKLGLLKMVIPSEPLAVKVVPDAGTPASGAAAG